ncbi:hypothetical protein MTO96_039697 [Rhipicephalus appendiculatus]
MMEAGRRFLSFVKRKFSRRRERNSRQLRETVTSCVRHQRHFRNLRRNEDHRSAQLPPLPKEDFKVVVRRSQGLPIKELTAPQIAEAVVNACQGKITGSQFLLRLKPGSNIFIISTPDQDVADITRKITGLTLNGRLHAVNAYAAVGDGPTERSSTYDIAPNTRPGTLLANLRI